MLDARDLDANGALLLPRFMYRNRVKVGHAGLAENRLDWNGCIQALRGFGDPDRGRAVKTDFFCTRQTTNPQAA